jgi:hypothetical protein
MTLCRARGILVIAEEQYVQAPALAKTGRGVERIEVA